MNIEKELEPIYLFVPTKNQLVTITEGSGDNLSYADRQEGFIDYIYYTQYDMEYGDISEIDGGIIMRKEFLRDEFKSLVETIPLVFDMAYGDENLDYVNLIGDKRE